MNVKIKLVSQSGSKDRKALLDGKFVWVESRDLSLALSGWMLGCLGVRLERGRHQASMLSRFYATPSPVVCCEPLSRVCMWCLCRNICKPCRLRSLPLAFLDLKIQYDIMKEWKSCNCYYVCEFVLIFLSLSFRSTANSQKLRKGSWKSVLYFQSVAVLLVRNRQD